MTAAIPLVTVYEVIVDVVKGTNGKKTMNRFLSKDKAEAFAAENTCWGKSATVRMMQESQKDVDGWEIRDRVST